MNQYGFYDDVIEAVKNLIPEELRDVHSALVRVMGGEAIHISATSPKHINAMDLNREYGDGANPVILKSEFVLSLCGLATDSTGLPRGADETA